MVDLCCEPRSSQEAYGWVPEGPCTAAATAMHPDRATAVSWARKQASALAFRLKLNRTIGTSFFALWLRLLRELVSRLGRNFTGGFVAKFVRLVPLARY